MRIAVMLMLLGIIAVAVFAVAVVLHRISNILLLWRTFDIEQRRKEKSPDS
jgi:hypothetical protein